MEKTAHHVLTVIFEERKLIASKIPRLLTRSKTATRDGTKKQCLVLCESNPTDILQRFVKVQEILKVIRHRDQPGNT